MGYDLHMTRRKDWVDQGDDISFDEFVAYVRSDAEFTYPSQLGDDFAYWHSSQTGHDSWLWWNEGRIDTKNPESEFIDKMVAVAKSLGAKVQGDEGEVYLSATEILKDEADENPPPQPRARVAWSPAFLRWPFWKQLVAAFLFGCILLGLKLLIFGP
jgi:hypothetical protein